MKNHYSNVQSIHHYLDLFHRPWYVELESEDFGASLSSLLELPISIYNNQRKDFFLGFITNFLQKCSISFIQRDSSIYHIDLALTGFWNKKMIAIPLWILNDALIGFEIILGETDFQILDSFPLFWKTPITRQHSDISTRPETREKLVLDIDIYCGDAIYLKIDQRSIIITNFNPRDDLEFFERIASAIIPEIDED